MGTNGLPAARVVSGALDNLFEVQFLRRKGPSPAGLAYAVEFSGDLMEWSAGQTPVVTSLGEDWESVAVRDVAPNSNLSRFARVSVTLQP